MIRIYLRLTVFQSKHFIMDVMGERKRIVIIDVTAEYLPLGKLEFLKLYWLDSWLEVISIVEIRRL